MEDKKFALFLTHKRLLLLGGFVFVILILAVFFLFSPKTRLLPANTADEVNILISPEFPSDQSNTPLLQQAIDDQQTVDQDYALWQETIRDDFPWKKHLPVYSESYYVYFDINEEIFIARLYLAPDDDINLIKQEILTSLDSKGIPYDDYPFQWLSL